MHQTIAGSAGQQHSPQLAASVLRVLAAPAPSTPQRQLDTELQPEMITTTESE